ncbi:hemolysin family protein [Mariniluteicoccus endophyticus]
MTTSLLLLGLTILLILANGFFVAAEFALVTVDRNAVRRAKAEGDAAAESVDKALRTLSTQLSGCQLGITLTSLVVGFIAEPAIADLISPVLEAFGLPRATALAVSITAAMAIATVTQMVFGELVPKNWAIAEPMRLARWVATPHRMFSLVTKPLLVFFNGAANVLVRAVGLEPQEELGNARTVKELSALARHSAREGTIDAELAHHMSQSAELGTRFARDAMTPRARVRFLDDDDSVAKILEVTRRTGHSRFVVTGQHADDIVGVVHFKYALAVPADQRLSRTVGEVMTPAVFVPSSMPLDDVLERLRHGLQVAVVVDEYGGTDGIVTLEDLVEEIVGEIADEQDEERPRHEQLTDGRWRLTGMIRPDELRHIAGLELPEGLASETLGGLVTERLTRFAEVGDAVTVRGRDHAHPDADGLAPWVDVHLTVERVDGHRVDLVGLTTSPVTDDEETSR